MINTILYTSYQSHFDTCWLIINIIFPKVPLNKTPLFQNGKAGIWPSAAASQRWNQRDPSHWTAWECKISYSGRPAGWKKMCAKHTAGWWLGHPSENYESQLGWLFPIYGKIKNVPNHQPDCDLKSIVTIKSGAAPKFCWDVWWYFCGCCYIPRFIWQT